MAPQTENQTLGASHTPLQLSSAGQKERMPQLLGGALGAMLQDVTDDRRFSTGSPQRCFEAWIGAHLWLLLLIRLMLLP